MNLVLTLAEAAARMASKAGGGIAQRPREHQQQGSKVESEHLHLQVLPI